MRYLNKIVFINSADKSLKYSEVDLDGNVHFIGTQGVGKSTLLRAVLFFYSADMPKLGIPREKKNYNEYYFPYQNSYIIYEVQTEAGKFCVLSFKSQGRVAFRFLNTGYDKKFFIDSEGKAFETWDKIREVLDKVDSTRIISSYEEYRNILYGNNKGLSNEFRKYVLIESKQYQNIPRTIANVFLNAKLDAEFVKETIIKSLNEDEVKIDLSTYSQTHLTDFETNLNDIKKWTERKIDKQAEKVATTYSELKFLEQKKKELAFQLGYAINKVKEDQPKVEQQLNAEELKRDSVKEKLKDLDGVFDKKKGEIQKQIGEILSKLKDISTKKTEYEVIQIEVILERVAKKSTLDLEKKNLSEEKNILTSKFLEIQQRYEAQLGQLENQLTAFENTKQTEKNNANSNFIHFKDELNKQYELIYEEIRKQHQDDFNTANSQVKEMANSISEKKIKLSETKHKIFYETEITNTKSEIVMVKSTISKAETQVQLAKDKIKSLQKEWELDEKNVKTKVGSGAIVEFAIKMPNNNNLSKTLWLPIDSKFPKEDYEALVDAYDEGDVSKLEVLRKAFKSSIIKNAKDIKEKYIDPPNTTEYGIMFLPFESLFAEVLRTPGLFELLQNEYKITITGPTTLSALLNSLQMGFRTLAIEKRSSEVWDILSVVKTEFGKFGSALEKTKKKLQEATNTIDSVGVRSRKIERKLKDVQELPGKITQAIVESENEEIDLMDESLEE